MSSEVLMTALSHKGSDIEVDEDGFLVKFEDWTEDTARALAERDGIHHLSEDQLDILRFMRRYYEKHRFFPIVRAVCRSVGQPKDCVAQKFIDPVTAWKIAGLPNPGEEVRNFHSWEPLGF